MFTGFKYLGFFTHFVKTEREGSKELEEMIRRLLQLTAKKPLKGDALDEARLLMIRLRGMGFTNEEVERLTGGAWRKDTIKLYTRGSEVMDRTMKDEAIEYSLQAIRMGMKVEDITKATSITRELALNSVTLADVIDLSRDAKKEGLSLATIIRVHKDLGTSGITTKIVQELLDFKSHFESMGFSIESLRVISSIAKRFGGFKKLMDAITRYQDIEAMNKACADLMANKRDLEIKNTQLEQDSQEQIKAKEIRGEEIQNLQRMVEDSKKRHKKMEEELEIEYKKMEEELEIEYRRKKDDLENKYSMNKKEKEDELAKMHEELTEGRAEIEAVREELNQCAGDMESIKTMINQTAPVASMAL